ncbi:MAG: hypothetical protein H6816_08675 [Phycisphaerales bacterium]|nr:hypothetical protein [Phycisphaerales bacterium]
MWMVLSGRTVPPEVLAQPADEVVLHALDHLGDPASLKSICRRASSRLLTRAMTVSPVIAPPFSPGARTGRCSASGLLGITN